MLKILWAGCPKASSEKPSVSSVVRRIDMNGFYSGTDRLWKEGRRWASRDPGTLGEVLETHDTYLEDASGLKGWAEDVLFPRTEGEVLEILRRATDRRVPITPVGRPLGDLPAEESRKVGGRSHWIGLTQSISQIARHGPGSRYLVHSTRRSITLRSILCARSHRDHRLRRRHDRHKCKRVPKLSIRKHSPAHAVAACCFDGRHDPYVFCCGDTIPFEVPRVMWPNTTKCTAGYPLSPGMDWIDLLCGSEGTLGMILSWSEAAARTCRVVFGCGVFRSR